MIGFPYPPPARPRANILALFFSPFGRIGRLSFLLLHLGMVAGSLVLFWIGMFLGEHGFFLSDWQAFLPPLVLLFGAGGTLLVRRLNDVGRPRGWAALALLPRAGWLLAAERINLFRNDGWAEIAALLLVADLAVVLVGTAWPGQAETNRHGAVPD